MSEINLVELNKITTNLIGSVKSVFGDNIICILIHGSLIKGGVIKGFSDLDMQVFLKENCFDSFGLKLEKSLEIQKYLGEVNLSQIYVEYLQMFFFNPKKTPDWYYPPIAGTYKILWGKMPSELNYDFNKIKLQAIKLLKGLKETIANYINSFSDSTNSSLYRRVRLLSTTVFTSMYSLLSYNQANPEEIWKKTKIEIKNLINVKFKGKKMATHLVKFFKLIELLAPDHSDLEIARKAFFEGMNFLKECSKYSELLSL